MSSAGYSKRTLVQKLGIKPGFKIALINSPQDYLQTTLGPLPSEVVIEPLTAGSLDMVHFFTRSANQLNYEFPALKQAVTLAGMVWISWPKKASKIQSDVDENVVREIGLKHGLVDVKVCVIDAIWSGLKFVYRVKDRK